MAFQQLQPQAPRFEQLSDSSNPQAQAYARAALRRNGIPVPRGADAAALWRQFSHQRMLQRNQAQMAGPDQGDAIDPNSPLGTGSTTPGQYPTINPGQFEAPPQLGPGPRLPEGGFPDAQPAVDWRSRIAQMAQQLQAGAGAPQGGPQVGAPPMALAAQKMAHVQQAQAAAQRLAAMLAEKRPSRHIPRRGQRSGPRAY